MSITPKIETALEYIRLTILPLINGSGNYNHNLKRITREFITPEELQIHDYPCVSILDMANTEFTALGSYDCTYTIGGNSEDIFDGLPILIAGLVRVGDTPSQKDDNPLSKQINLLSSDIKIAMSTDITLGGSVLSCVLKSEKKSIIVAGESDLIGVTDQIYIIKYDFKPSASTPTT